jgi:hypothetical protein
MITPRRTTTEEAMLTSDECRQRAEEKLAEAKLEPQHEKRLLTAAEGWLVLAGIMSRVEAQRGRQVPASTQHPITLVVIPAPP